MTTQTGLNKIESILKSMKKIREWNNRKNNNLLTQQQLTIIDDLNTKLETIIRGKPSIKTKE